MVSRKVLDQLKIEIKEIENELIVYRKILGASPNPILITNNQMQIIYVNEAWVHLTGYKSDEVLGKNPRFLQSGKTPAAVYKKMWQHLQNGKPFSTREIIEKSKEGKEYQIHSAFFPVKNDGETIFYVQTMHDITAQKRIELLKTEFLSIAAHEIKTPLTTLKLIAQVLLRRFGHDEKNANAFMLLDREIARLANLVNELLDISRIETGRFHLNKERVDLVPLTREITKKMSLLAKSHEIVFYSNEKSILVFADVNRIEEVLINLLTNAVKYSAENTSVRITLSVRGSDVCISVSDSGIGIPKEQFTHVFERFYQIHEHRTSGFGLGLFIAKQIVKKHKGKIWVESTEGEGSTFYVSLPLLDQNNKRLYSKSIRQAVPVLQI